MQSAPKILIIPPSVPLSIAEKFQDENGISVYKGAIDKAKKLIQLYEKLSEEKNCYFLNTSEYIFPCEIDGLHIDENNHEKLANELADKVNLLFLKNE